MCLSQEELILNGFLAASKYNCYHVGLFLLLGAIQSSLWSYLYGNHLHDNNIITFKFDFFGVLEGYNNLMIIKNQHFKMFKVRNVINKCFIRIIFELLKLLSQINFTK